MNNLTDDELYKDAMNNIDHRSLEIIELRFQNLHLKEQQTKDKELIQQLVDALCIAHYGGGEDLQDEIPIRALGAARFAGYEPIIDTKGFEDRGYYTDYISNKK